MTHDYLPTPASDKTRDTDEVQKNLASFAAFDQWIDEQLEVLVAAWAHTAAPNANRPSRREKLCGR